MEKSKKWIKAASIRAIKTMAQAAVGVIGASYVLSEKEMEKSKKWIKAASIRAIKTMAQAAVGVIGASYVLSEIDFAVVASASVVAGLVSILTSVAGLPEVE